MLFKQVLTVFKSDNEINIAAAKLETGHKYELRSAKPELITNLWLSSKSTGEKLTREKEGERDQCCWFKLWAGASDCCLSSSSFSPGDGPAGEEVTHTQPLSPSHCLTNHSHLCGWGPLPGCSWQLRRRKPPSRRKPHHDYHAPPAEDSRMLALGHYTFCPSAPGGRKLSACIGQAALEG